MTTPETATEPESTEPAVSATPAASVTVRTNRREPCPCGSGKKFKNCHEGQPGFEVEGNVAPNAPEAPTAPVNVPKKTNQKHFPGQNARTIPSQPGHRAYFRNPGG